MQHEEEEDEDEDEPETSADEMEENDEKPEHNNVIDEQTIELAIKTSPATSPSPLLSPVHSESDAKVFFIELYLLLWLLHDCYMVVFSRLRRKVYCEISVNIRIQ